MKRWYCVLLAGLLLAALVGCGDGGDNPLALYKDGEPIIWLGMSRDEVYQTLGGDTSDDPTRAVHYGDFNIYYEGDIVESIFILTSACTDWRGVTVGMKKNDVYKRYDPSEVYYSEDDKYWSIRLKLDENKQILPPDADDYTYMIDSAAESPKENPTDRVGLMAIEGPYDWD